MTRAPRAGLDSKHLEQSLELGSWTAIGADMLTLLMVGWRYGRRGETATVDLFRWPASDDNVPATGATVLVRK